MPGMPWRIRPFLPSFCIFFIILDMVICCFSSLLTSWMVVPEPLAMRFLREAWMIFGLRRSAGVIEPNLSETSWCVYAWPANRGWTGVKIFFANQSGEITETKDNMASGANPPEIIAGGAYRTGDGTTITGETAMGTVGRDGAFWKRSN